MSNLDLTAPTGWNKWIYPKTTAPEDTQLPDASFPVIYTPGSAFWLKSEIDHCLIPWVNALDPFYIYALAGGMTGTILGATSALAVFAEYYKLWVAQGTWSAFIGSPGPRFGYCIGNKFKQEAYIRFDIQNVYSMIVLLNSGVELLENSRFKRIYVKQGEVVTYKIIGGEHLLTLDIDRLDKPPDLTNTGAMQIIQSDGKKFSINILGLKDNWDLIIAKPESVPKAGDFYELNDVWLIEDPYLLSGFWSGTENEVGAQQVTTGGFNDASGFNLFVTEHNKPFEHDYFTGVYIYKNKVITSTTAETSTTTATTTTIASNVVQATSGSNMRDLSDNEWCFLGFQNSKEISNTYKNDDRYKEVILPDPDGEGSIVVYEKRRIATIDDYEKVKASSNFIRVEINTGGYRTRHNWQAPCLEGNYIKVGDALYKILSHVEANIIDVSIKSIDGKSTFDPVSIKEYSILNQNAWIINENYFTSTSMIRSALFEGKIKSINEDGVLITIEKDPIILGNKQHGLSLSDRYKKDIILSGSYKKMFKKGQNWRLISENNEYKIESINFGEINDSGQYNISIGTSGDFPVGGEVYITFDNPFKTTRGQYTAKGGYFFDLKAAGGLSGTTTGFIASNVLCLQGEYMTTPYNLDIPVDTRIGVCDGYLFGIAGNGSAQNWEGVFMLATTPRAGRGLASLFHTLRQEGWIAYQDLVTKKITIRRGSSNFTEFPMKEMVVIGETATRENTDGTSTIALNTEYEWLRRIQFAEPISAKHGIMFATGTEDNMYGFYVSGDGVVNLNLLARQNVSNVSSRAYTSVEGYPVSPVYAYTKEAYNDFDNFIVNIGVKTQDGPIYVKDGEISGVKTEYVGDNQTLEDVGFFDIIRLPDGETIMLYGLKAGEFVVNEKVNNAISNNSAWSNKNAVMCIGTYDDDYSWAAPMVDRMDDAAHIQQYPIMLMNGVDYLSCIFCPRTFSLNIFARCFQDGEPYIGCFTLGVNDVLKNLSVARPVGFLAGTPEKFPLSFSYRHPAFEDAVMKDKARFWAGNIVDDGYVFNSKNGSLSDRFVRVMGSGITKCQVTYAKEAGIISTHLLPDGVQVLLYDGEGGVKAIFSSDSGWIWWDCQLIFAKDARSGFLLDKLLFYITSSGIEIKLTNYSDFYTALDLTTRKYAGKDIKNAEIRLQSSLDSEQHFLIGSGVIEPQRLSGYVANDGTYKVFFYDQNNLLKCMESSDMHAWKVANNF